MGASEDADRVYFASKAAIAGSGENSEGAEAQAGAQNLYLYDSLTDTTTFIATLAAGDVEGVRAPIKADPYYRTARVSPDGGAAAFASLAPLTGADNLDAVSGEPDTQVFHYDADSDRLRCVSCAPSGARPRLGREMEVNGAGTGLWQAGMIPGWPVQTYPSRLLSADGSRLFFNSTESLVLADTNSRLDVYEWEVGESQAACDALGADLFLKFEGGCLSLISTGQSSSDSEFVDADPSGRDAFIKTGESLLPQDPGLIDIYDAREGGGYPPPPPPPATCEGGACQTPPPPPPLPTPSSEVFNGPGNKTTKPKQCPKGKHKAKKNGKVVCVKNKKAKGKGAKGKANRNRGAAR